MKKRGLDVVSDTCCRAKGLGVSGLWCLRCGVRVHRLIKGFRFGSWV